MANVGLRREGRHVVASFRYDPAIVQVCKELGGRWDPKRRVWTFGIGDVPHLLDAFGEGVELDRSITDHLERKLQFNPDLPLPALNRKLMPHQVDAVRFLVKAEGRILADDVGLGKTTEIIAACEYRMVHHIPDMKILVLVLPSIAHNWVEEIRTVTPWREVSIFNPRRLDATTNTRYLICSYHTYRNHREKIQTWGPTLTVCDESHIIRNATSGVSKAVMDLESPLRIAATATLMPKDIRNLWPQVEWAVPGHLGSYWAFQKRYLSTQEVQLRGDQGGRVKKITDDDGEEKQVRVYTKITGQRNLDELAGLVGQVSMRRLRSEVLTLPDKAFVTRHVEMSPAQRKLYYKLRSGFTDIAALEEKEAINALENNTILLQCANDPAMFGEKPSTAKIDELMEILDDLDGNHQVIVWTQWHHQMDRLREVLKHDAVYVDGRMNDQAARHNAVTLFQKGFKRIFCGNPASIGTGVNLTAASVVVYLDRSYNTLYYIQSQGRNDRIGQVNKMLFYNLVVPGTVDELTLEVINRDIALQDQIQRVGVGDLRVPTVDYAKYFR